MRGAAHKIPLSRSIEEGKGYLFCQHVIVQSVPEFYYTFGKFVSDNMVNLFIMHLVHPVMNNFLLKTMCTAVPRAPMTAVFDKAFEYFFS